MRPDKLNINFVLTKLNKKKNYYDLKNNIPITHVARISLRPRGGKSQIKSSRSKEAPILTLKSTL
jgi:hypothetical protein